MLRAFIAIELPAAIQDAICKQTLLLKQKLGDQLVRWVPQQNLHLTLKFLGEVSTSNMDFLKQILLREAESQSPFDLQFGGLGSFPNSKRPRVIWIGIQAPPVLTSIQRNIESATEKLGYAREERPFSPHLTLGRVRQTVSQGEHQRVRSVLESMQLGRINPARVDSVDLFKSELKPSGSIYTRLFRAVFKQSK